MVMIVWRISNLILSIINWWSNNFHIQPICIPLFMRTILRIIHELFIIYILIICEVWIFFLFVFSEFWYIMHGNKFMLHFPNRDFLLEFLMFQKPQLLINFDILCTAYLIITRLCEMILLNLWKFILISTYVRS